MNFTVLLLGSDANAYYMARCFHELYHKKVDLMNYRLIAVTEHSRIINFIETPEFKNGDLFVSTLNEYAQKSSFEKILLIATSDKYVRLVVENKEKLDTKFSHNYPTLDIVNNLLLKDNFYTLYKDELPIPKTLIYSCAQKGEIKNDFEYPIILKPGNGVAYNAHPFEGAKKVYKIFSFEELKRIVLMIIQSGYNDNLIIQEYIPGDDTCLYDMVFYVGSDKKARLATFAEIGLQERTPTGVGNCTVLVNGFDERGYKEDLVYKMKEFLEHIGYQGFCEFDFKYDSRDGRYKVLEINPRQARSSYYLSACGYNLVQTLIDDCILHKTEPFILIKNEMALSFVPKFIIKKYVTSEPLKQKIWQLAHDGKYVRPLHYKNDQSFFRILYLFLHDITYYIKYKKHNW